MPKASRQPNAPSPSDRIEQDLEKAILSGQFSVGDKLPTESELCDRYDTSRPVVREAIRALIATGLVVTQQGSGSYVAENAWEKPLRLSLERYGSQRGESSARDELWDLRLIVETQGIRRLIAPRAETSRARLAEQLTRMEAAKNDPRVFGDEDIAFHLEIVKAANNELLTAIHRGLMRGLGDPFMPTVFASPEFMQHTLRDHHDINQAVQALDEEKAVRRLGEHIDWSRRYMHANAFDVQL